MGYIDTVQKISEEHKPKIMSFKRKKGSVFHNSSSKNHIVNVLKAQEEFSKQTVLKLRNADVSDNQNNYHQEEFDINSEDLMY